jgi:hypothetical protein
MNIDVPDPSMARIGDFNGDGLDDVVSPGPGHKGIRILLNDGFGGFVIVDKPLREKNVRGLAVADINGDGLSDIILTAQGMFWGLEGKILLNISQRMEN